MQSDNNRQAISLLDCIYKYYADRYVIEESEHGLFITSMDSNNDEDAAAYGLDKQYTLEDVLRDIAFLIINILAIHVVDGPDEDGYYCVENTLKPAGGLTITHEEMALLRSICIRLDEVVPGLFNSYESLRQRWLRAKIARILM